MDAMKLLVADDSSVFREALIQELSDDETKITAAEDGLKALELARRDNPNIVLLDVLMPGMDGYAVCRALREDEKTRNAIIIMLTSKDGFSDKIKGFESGADDYLTKPIDFRWLSARVRRYRDGLQGRPQA